MMAYKRLCRAMVLRSRREKSSRPSGGQLPVLFKMRKVDF